MANVRLELTHTQVPQHSIRSLLRTGLQRFLRTFYNLAQVPGCRQSRLGIGMHKAALGGHFSCTGLPGKPPMQHPRHRPGTPRIPSCNPMLQVARSVQCQAGLTEHQPLPGHAPHGSKVWRSLTMLAMALGLTPWVGLLRGYCGHADGPWAVGLQHSLQPGTVVLLCLVQYCCSAW